MTLFFPFITPREAQKTDSAALAAAIIGALHSGGSASYMDERQMQEQIARVFDSKKLDYQREAALPGDAGRIDFLCDRVGVEVKIQSSLSELTRQLHRYAHSGALDLLILASPRARLLLGIRAALEPPPIELARPPGVSADRLGVLGTCIIITQDFGGSFGGW